ncbi:MAG: hypothetical protein B7Y80_01600 [Hyphomicrobium sp. 32-62-53]|nr:MAG: hypothetical protein B7Z29_01950 [Hyphomicrobium sp. 12-62-95]OYY01449.1 MAG: hypothetical protein B7Y80_01600 [Hyphomicrobium sp. 32-62-53]
MTVAKIILAQLGGNRFIAMTGARNFVGHPAALSFKLPRGLAGNKASHVKITLDANDTYTIDFLAWNARKLEMRTISSTPGAYADDLQRVFTLETGLDTRL